MDEEKKVPETAGTEESAAEPAKEPEKEPRMESEEAFESIREIAEVDGNYRNQDEDLECDLKENDEREVRVIHVWDVGILMKRHTSHGDDHEDG